MSPTTLPDVVRKKKAIQFDLFHTLTALETTWGDSRPFTYQMLGVDREAWRVQLWCCSRDRLIGTMADPLAIVESMAHAIDPSIPDEVIRAATENRTARFAAALIDIPDRTVRVLRRLKAMGLRIGLISNADVTEAAAWPQSPIAYMFDSTLFSCFAGCVKPEAEIYRKSLDELGASPAEAIFVGDGGSEELVGAQQLGITTVMIMGIIREIWPERIPDRARYADFAIEELEGLLD